MRGFEIIAIVVGVFFVIGIAVGMLVVIVLPLFQSMSRQPRYHRRYRNYDDRPESRYRDEDDRRPPRWPSD